MVTFVLVLHIIVTVCLVGLVLIQKNEGGGLGMGGGNMGGMMSARGTANLLTRTTAVLAALFFMSTLGLAIYFKGGNREKSILNGIEAAEPKTQDAPELPPAPPVRS